MAGIKDLKRMCDSYEKCSDCPMGDTCRGDSVLSLPDNTDEIVNKWVQEHPVKTYAMDFFEKFPNAQVHNDKTPSACREQVYGGCCPKEFDKVSSCKDCWNMEMKK